MPDHKDPISVRRDAHVDIRFHDGALPHAKGVKNYQVLRACRDPRWAGDELGWTYNHAPMLAWWRGRFFVEYLSNPKTEHLPPSRTLLSMSEDGRRWSAPRELFPPLRVAAAPYRGPAKDLLAGIDFVDCNCHQRMGFYVSPDGRLLASAFYGVSPEIHAAPNSGWGVGRVVREIHPDLSFGPIYFLRWNEAAGYDRENAGAFPFFEESPDPGFRAACQSFLRDRLAVQQWWEEQRFDPELFTVPGGAALCTYTLPGGDVIGLYKTGLVIRSSDGGETWTEKRPAYSLNTNTAKVWGQRTADGRYALAYNPSRDGAHRWPLCAVTGEDGERFGDMLALVPEISPCRYEGGLKNLGAQYVRGIAEHNPRPADGQLRLTYSVNKEDIWVLEAPLPLRGEETKDVHEAFADLPPGAVPEAWNLYVPKWCGVQVEDAGDRRALVLRDRDPWDRPRAERLIPPSRRIRLRFELCAEALRAGTAMVVTVEDDAGREAVRLCFDADGILRVRTAGAVRERGCYPEGWFAVELRIDCEKGEALLRLDGADAPIPLLLNQPVDSVARVCFTTRAALPWNTLEDQGVGGMLTDLPGDVPQAESRFALASFSAERE